MVFLGKIPAAFESSAEIYGLHGRADQMTSAGSMPEALEIWKYILLRNQTVTPRK